LNLIQRYKFNGNLIYVNERALSCMNFNDEEVAIMRSRMAEAKKIQSFISKLQERKIKVHERLKKLGIFNFV
jgi:hypothetical protein